MIGGLPGTADGGEVSAEERNARIRAAVRRKYETVASSADGNFKYPTGKEGAELLGYEEGILAGIPDELLNSFCGVGNPFAIAPLKKGASVVDIGSGAGFDLLVAHHKTSGEGRICGVDLTPQMIAKAEALFEALGVDNVEVFLVEEERLPLADAGFDVVISNGVINLAVDKAKLFAEIYRILKPGGRLQFADIVLEKELPPDLASSAESWAH